MIGNNSCGVHSVMAGRTADNVHSLDIVTYDGLRMTIGPTPPDELERIIAEGGRRGQIYRGMRDFWTEHGRHFEEVYPDIPRRVSGYENLDQLSPEKGFNVARALTGTEANCALVLKAHARSRRQSRSIGSWRSSASPMSIIAGDHALGGPQFRPHRAGRHRPPAGRVHGEEALQGEGSRGAAGGQGLADRRIRRRQRRGRGRTGPAHGRKDEPQGLFQARIVTDNPNRPKSGRCARPRWPSLPMCPAPAPHGPAGRIRAVHVKDLGNYLRDLKALFDKYGYEASVYGHFGDGLVHCRIDFDLHSEDGLRNWRAFLDEAARHRGALWRLAFGRAWRWPGARRIAGEDVWRRAHGRAARLPCHLGPAPADESGQAARSLSHHLQSARRARIPAAGNTRPVRLS